jgi:prophage regulatory protein
LDRVGRFFLETFWKGKQMRGHFLKAKEVMELTGLSRVTIWRMERDGNFPRRVEISPRRIGWIKSELDEWAANRPRVEAIILPQK